MNTNKILSWALTVSLFVIPFLCLIVTNSTFFPFITGKNFAFRIVVEIALAIWLVLLARGATNGPKKSWITISVLFFIIIATLAAIFGVNPYHSFWSNYERMDGLITLLHMFAYFLMLISFLNTEKLWNRYLHTSLLSAIIVSILGVWQFMGWSVINQGGSRIDATFGNATYLAVYMLFHICIALYYMFKREDPTWRKYGYGALIALFAVVLYHTATRGAILGLVGALLLASVLSLFSTKGAQKKWVLITLGSILVIVIGFILARNTSYVAKSPVLSRFAHMSFSDATTQSRRIIWGIALKGAKEHPILGYGQENFNVVFNKYFDPRLYSQETWFDRAHNIIFEWLIAGGILGLLAYLSLYVVSAWTLWKRHSDIVSPMQRNLIIGLLAGYLFQNIFVFDNLFSYVMFFIILGFIHYHSAEVEFPRWIDKFWSGIRSFFNRFVKGFSIVATTFVVLGTVIILYWANVKPIQANKLMLRTLYPRAISQEKFDNMQKVFALNTFGSAEAREQLLFMLTEARTAPNVDKDLFLKFLDLGAKEMQKQLEQSGNDARHQLFMGSFLHTFGRADIAVNYFENAVKLSPNKQIALFSLARAYMDLGRNEDALKVTKFAYELDTKFDRALVEYISAAIMAKQFALADQLLATDQGKTQSSDPRIVDAYARSGKIDKVIAIWKRVIEENPKNQQAYFSLAASYYTANMDSQAIRTLQNVKVAIPESKQQADYYIEQIRTGKLPR